jgi:mycothiol synthase
MDAVAGVDGDYPLSEHVVLHLRHGGDADVRHLLTTSDSGEVIGYAHVDVTDQVAGSSAEMAVHPDHRRAGLGRALVEAALQESPDGRLRLWAHGEHPAATALAHRLGFERSRALFQMRRSLFTPVPAPDVPDGIRIRTFQVGRDEAAWTRVNARAFADHPDQGRWTERDLRLREEEPWFDPAGFFLAERKSDGVLLCFHWTKVHGADPLDGPGTHDHEHDHEPIGEVYVVGVDPDAQGLRLGAALTLAGLRHLRGRGLAQAMLYVDESNERAVRLYEKLDFTRWSTDICFAKD